MENEEYQLDRADLKLLQLLQHNALASTDSLGEAAQLSPTAAKRRVNKLRSNGTIVKNAAVVDPKRLGFNVFTLAFVNLERDRREIVQNFKQSIADNPRITQGFYTTGDSDFVLLIASKSLEDYESFTQEFFWENADIKSFKTMVVMDNIKLGFELPIDC
ncbi:MAG: Lrp/AsnC family leucine-responsive transcriptional regulator [Saprospiraceae bacterium]|jgi:Lrp/AsnC family leucine-responsive transcriptional regulator